MNFVHHLPTLTFRWKNRIITTISSNNPHVLSHIWGNRIWIGGWMHVKDGLQNPSPLLKTILALLMLSQSTLLTFFVITHTQLLCCNISDLCYCHRIKTAPTLRACWSTSSTTTGLRCCVTTSWKSSSLPSSRYVDALKSPLQTCHVQYCWLHLAVYMMCSFIQTWIAYNFIPTIAIERVVMCHVLLLQHNRVGMGIV